MDTTKQSKTTKRQKRKGSNNSGLPSTEQLGALPWEFHQLVMHPNLLSLSGCYYDQLQHHLFWDH
jgi:hypothetical protein